MLGIVALVMLGLALVGRPIVELVQIISALLKFFLQDWWNRHLFFTDVEPWIVSFLESKFEYYQKLTAQDKSMFARRVQKFIDLKKFTGRDLQITREMQVLVAAAAIQITFGFPSVYLSPFENIIIYPTAYYSASDGRYHHGEVHTKGAIVLSWEHLVRGYLEKDDGRNLALHELAHALQFANATKGADYDFLDDKVFALFRSYAHDEIEKISNGEPSIFRAYAATNEHEFFAVAVENFFERSQEFADLDPTLYATMVRLLQQDPLKMSV